jgi:hypothetical protein
VGEDLYADSLGEEGTQGANYLGALEANAAAMFEAFSSGAHSPCPLSEGSP